MINWPNCICSQFIFCSVTSPYSKSVIAPHTTNPKHWTVAWHCASNHVTSHCNCACLVVRPNWECTRVIPGGLLNSLITMDVAWLVVLPSTKRQQCWRILLPKFCLLPRMSLSSDDLWMISIWLPNGCSGCMGKSPRVVGASFSDDGAVRRRLFCGLAWPSHLVLGPAYYFTVNLNLDPEAGGREHRFQYQTVGGICSVTYTTSKSHSSSQS